MKNKKEKLSTATKKKLNELASFLEENILEKEFDMDDFVSVINRGKFSKEEFAVSPENAHTCGTACCIAGWQIIKDGFCLGESGEVKTRIQLPFQKKLEYLDTGFVAFDFARRSLGLNDEQACSLFYPDRWPGYSYGGGDPDKKTKKIGLFDNTPKGAAERIRHFIKTGK
jgi:hypothetical protein